ncbi:MAG TPA: nucleotide disphospho-sugar-binding domain-containing protein [Acidimicrobiales bacterium]|nr:nucleotide disphospho-sugar-binding domain-containing protein [Acidimicrobiales bacterium]
MPRGSRPLTVLFMPESAYGPTNNCIGIGAVLAARGHRVVFASETSWRGRLEPLGFEEDLVALAPPRDAGNPDPGAPDPGASSDAGRFWTDFVKETAPFFRLPTLEQLEHFVQPTWRALLDGARFVQEQLLGVVGRQRPDVVVEDNVCAFPALVTAGVPFVRVVSCNPLEVGGATVPPKFSGYPVADRTAWAAYRAEYERLHRELWCEFDEWVRACGAPGLGDLEFVHESEALNLYVYPEVVDYTDRRPMGERWHRLESCVRGTEGSPTPELAEFLARPGGALVYLSLGSLGSADVGLMERLVATLARTPHRYVVSKGPLADDYELADNMWGASQVPQTQVLASVDLVVTHGGNNTTTECFHFGKPMVVLPLFWDQHDNAQRVEETGFGRRLATYGHDDAQLIGAVDGLLADGALRARMARLGAAIRARRGVERAATLIEEVARAGSVDA